MAAPWPRSGHGHDAMATGRWGILFYLFRGLQTDCGFRSSGHHQWCLHATCINLDQLGIEILASSGKLWQAPKRKMVRLAKARDLQGRSIGWQANDAAKGEGIATLTSFCGKLSAFPALSAWYHGCTMTLYGCSTFTLTSFYSKWLQFTSFYIIKLHLCSSADRSETAGCTQRRWEHFSKQRMNLEMAL